MFVGVSEILDRGLMILLKGEFDQIILEIYKKILMIKYLLYRYNFGLI